MRVQPLLQKYSGFPKNQITLITHSVSSHSRGISRSSRTRGGMRWTQAALLTRALFLRTEKSCGPDASTPASSWQLALPMTVTKKPDHRLFDAHIFFGCAAQ